uniref:Transmembrane protein n=1 Tax=Neospora caninum (strain Liverpool) TaxID=572307 RepID=A0A0F7USH0_NEOCL|nr:TPA: hypothetical protein BN1204_067040 [Neospora caninum Liverpool]
MDGVVQVTAARAPLSLAEGESEVTKAPSLSAWSDHGDELGRQSQQEDASSQNSVSEDASSIASSRQSHDFLACARPELRVGEGVSILHTAVESFAFYLYLAFVPGWIACCLAKVPPFAFWTPSIVGAGAFWISLNIWGPLFSRGAVTDPYSALIGSWAEMSLAKHRAQISCQEKEVSRRGEAASSEMLHPRGLSTGDLIKIFIATVGAASLVGVVVQAFFPGHLPYGPPLTMQIYTDMQSPGTKEKMASTNSRHTEFCSSVFMSLLTPLPIHLQEEAARIVSASLLSMADLIVVSSKVLGGYAWIASTWLLPPEQQERLLQFEMLGWTLAGRTATGGFVDVVHRLRVSPSENSFEMLLWFSRVVDVFLGECLFSCLNYMAQAADLSVGKITRRSHVRVTGLGTISLNVGTMVYLVGSPFCRVTGGPLLNPCFAAMVMLCRGDFFAFWLLAIAGFTAAFLASSVVKPIIQEEPAIEDRRQLVTRVSTWEDKPESMEKDE